MAKDTAYHLGKLQASIKARIPAVIFRLWDPLTAWVEGCARRAAEISADIAQVGNDFYIDSAKGARLDRRLENEGVFRLLAKPADDGTVTLTRQTAPIATTTFPVGAIKVAPPPDPSKPAANRPTYVNSAALTIGPGQTSWTVAFEAERGGADTNMPATQALQLLNTSLLDTATVAAAFTNGTDDEADDAYRQRGKLEVRSRTKGTDEALVAAALRGGATFAYTVENTGAGQVPVSLYAAIANGTLPAPIQTEILRHINGDPAAVPPIPAARVKGVQVEVLAASTVTFDFSIGLVLEAWVVGDTLTALQADMAAAIGNYVRALNSPGATDRVMRINRVKDICLTFRGRGVLDVVNGTFLPNANTTLTAQQMAVMGTLTWL